MCSMGKIASCEIAFTPIASKDYNDDVKKVLDIIKSFDLKYNVGIMSTSVVGEKEKIFELISEIYNHMEDKCKFAMDVKLSNVCGCEQSG